MLIFSERTVSCSLGTVFTLFPLSQPALPFPAHMSQQLWTEFTLPPIEPYSIDAQLRICKTWQRYKGWLFISKCEGLHEEKHKAFINYNSTTFRMTHLQLDSFSDLGAFFVHRWTQQKWTHKFSQQGHLYFFFCVCVPLNTKSIGN